LAAALGYFWWTRGYHAEGSRWLEEALARVPKGEADAAVGIQALIAAGRMLTYRGELDRARALLREALAEAEQRPDPARIAQTLTYLGLRAVFSRDFTEAAQVLAAARMRWEDLDDPFHLGLTLHCLGAVAFAQGDYAQAEALEVAALSQLSAAGDARLAGTAHFAFAVIEWRRGDLSRAMQRVREGLQASAGLRGRWPRSFGARATVALVGEHADLERSARLLGAADALSQATGATGVSTYERLPTFPNVAPLRERLTQEGWGAAYREGRSVPVGELAPLALTLLEEVTRALASPKTALNIAMKSPQPP